MSKIEIVTPRSGEKFLNRLLKNDPTLDFLCLELFHWGFNEIMDWLQQFNIICENNPSLTPPAITVHGYRDDVTADMLAGIEELGAVWIPRTENNGKDCATVLQEKLRIRYPQKSYEESGLGHYTKAQEKQVNMWSEFYSQANPQFFAQEQQEFVSEVKALPDDAFAM